MAELPKIKAEEEAIREKYARRTPVDDRYSFFNAGLVFMVQDRERRILEVLKRYGVKSLEGKRILEVGCGYGSWLREFMRWGAKPESLIGVELLPARVDEARRLSPQGITFIRGSAARLDFPDNSFDLVLQSTVFTSIQDDDLKHRVAAEMMRVVRPNGLILWYDFRWNNPRNPDVTGVGKKEIVRLFAGCRVDLFPMTLAPPLVRPLARWSWLGCYLLGKVPWLCSHYLGIIRKQ